MLALLVKGLTIIQVSYWFIEKKKLKLVNITFIITSLIVNLINGTIIIFSKEQTFK